MLPIKSKRRKKLSKADRQHMMDCKETVCMPCDVWARDLGMMPIEDIATQNDYDHSKSGNVRRGHRFGYASCLWHHRGRVEVEGWTIATLRAHFGPSLMDGSDLFHRTYGSDDELIARQKRILGCE